MTREQKNKMRLEKLRAAKPEILKRFEEKQAKKDEHKRRK